MQISISATAKEAAFYMADPFSPEKRSYTMSQIKSKDTKPESAVRKYLFSRGLRYRKNDNRYPGHPDIVLPKYKTVIFVNGCFWHSHEGCSNYSVPKSNTDYWIPKLAKNRERDALNASALEKDGWKVIVVWECELKKKLQAQRLERLYEEIVHPPSEKSC
ncbi:MAG: DNA mismatch endonuclease Vsr [Clostridiales bacterium]|jgi:DNA mismatch endonuclease (patch repair protein)|nr:DNA mismatch endonuclease Vsr [Clostridiales bacterium]